MGQVYEYSKWRFHLRIESIPWMRGWNLRSKFMLHVNRAGEKLETVCNA